MSPSHGMVVGGDGSVGALIPTPGVGAAALGRGYEPPKSE